MKAIRKLLAHLAAWMCVMPLAARGADHLDTPTVIADPAADIGDLYAWMSPDASRLNLVLTIVGRRFSDQVSYVFHVDSGERFGDTTAYKTIRCTFDAAEVTHCRLGQVDEARGDASDPRGIEGMNRRLRVFAGLRDDPYFNNVRGTRAALNVVAGALKAGAGSDGSGCPILDAASLAKTAAEWRATDGGPPRNFLAGWKTAALVVAVDVEAVAPGGRFLGVWAGTYRRNGERIDRMGRPLTGNGLLGPFAPPEASAPRKEAYNRAAPGEWPLFVDELEQTLALYDGLDGVCGNQWHAGRTAGRGRHRALAKLLADDRLWVDARSGTCRTYLAVELGAAASTSGDCGGRALDYNVNGIFRSLLIRGTTASVDDGVPRDDREHSATAFPFVAAP